jgi:hypothetical protein
MNRGQHVATPIRTVASLDFDDVDGKRWVPLEDWPVPPVPSGADWYSAAEQNPTGRVCLVVGGGIAHLLGVLNSATSSTAVPVSSTVAARGARRLWPSVAALWEEAGDVLAAIGLQGEPERVPARVGASRRAPSTASVSLHGIRVCRPGGGRGTLGGMMIALRSNDA